MNFIKQTLFCPTCNKETEHTNMREIGCLRCRRRIARKKYNIIHKEIVYKKNRDWFLANPERRKQYAIESRKNNPQKHRDNIKRFRDKNKELVYKRVKEWKDKNKEKVLYVSYKWKKRNPEKVRISELPGRLRRRGNTNREEIKEFMIETLMWRGGYYCERCGRELNFNEKRILHIDHIIPLAVGGNGNKKNLQLLCQRCNLTKGIKIEDYRTSLLLGESNAGR